MVSKKEQLKALNMRHWGRADLIFRVFAFRMANRYICMNTLVTVVMF
jgi:hypothetical protein